MESTNKSRNFRLPELIHLVRVSYKAEINATGCVYCSHNPIKLTGHDY